MKPRRVYVTVALDVNPDWYDLMADDVRAEDVVAADVDQLLRLASRGSRYTVVRCEASELPT